MNDEKTFDHRPDPELGAALRRALDPVDPSRNDHASFVAQVMAHYDDALRAGTVPTWQVLAAWSRRGLAVAAAAAVLIGFLVGRSLQMSDPPETFDTAMASSSGPGLTALVTVNHPDASVVFASLVEQR